jgi:hypothetical protein
MREGNKGYFEWQASSSAETIKLMQINKTDRLANSKAPEYLHRRAWENHSNWKLFSEGLS